MSKESFSIGYIVDNDMIPLLVTCYLDIVKRFSLAGMAVALSANKQLRGLSAIMFKQLMG